MRREKVLITGIVRSNSDQLTPPGVCEELINLRNEGGLKTVASKRVLLAEKTYSKVIEHITADFNHLIAVIGNKVYLVNRTDGTTTEIHTCPTVDIELATLNNMLIIMCSHSSRMVVYQYKSSYTLLFNGLPAMATIQRYSLEEGDTKVNGSSKSSTGTISASVPHSPSTIRGFKENIAAAMTEARNLDPEFCEGYVLVSTSYTLFDGTETKMSPPTMYKLGGYNVTPIKVEWAGSMIQNYWVNVQVERLDLSLGLPSNYNQFADLIKYVNIYCTRAISYYKTTLEGITLKFDGSNTLLETSEVAANTFNEELFQSELFYRQFQIEINSIEDRYHIKFGDALVTGKTMPVDSSGWVNVVGKPFVYNNRLHLFDFKKTLVAEQEVFLMMTFAETSPLPSTTYLPGTERTGEYYYSVSTISAFDCWNKLGGTPTVGLGIIWYDPTDGNYYTTQEGSVLVDPGWYLVNYGASVAQSVIWAIRIEEIEPEETTEDGTTEIGTTEEAGTTEDGTTEIGTTEEPRVSLTNYGFHATSWEFAFLYETPRAAYFDFSDNKYYAEATGSTLASEGFYVVTKGATQYDSEYIFIDQFGVGSMFYPESTTEAGTTIEGTTEPGTTAPPPPPEPIVCNGFDAYAQNDADTHILSNNYNTRNLYPLVVEGSYVVYADDVYTTYAQEGYYSVGTYAFGVERQIQIGANGVPLFDSDGILAAIPNPVPDITTTDAGTTDAGTTLAPRASWNFYGYDADSKPYCFSSNISGIVWSDPNDNLWYTTSNGSVLIADGWYMWEKNSGVEDSVFNQFANGLIIG